MSAAEALPGYDVRTVHSLPVDAPPERALAAAREVRAAEARLVRTLLLVRGMRTRADRPLWDSLTTGFVRYDDDETLVAITKPWRPRGAKTGLSDSVLQRRFREFAEPGWAKLALDFRAEEGRLVTETRVQLTDEAARRAFRRYWFVVRPFSGLVRRSWLAAAKRRAEKLS